MAQVQTISPTYGPLSTVHCHSGEHRLEITLSTAKSPPNETNKQTKKDISIFFIKYNISFQVQVEYLCLCYTACFIFSNRIVTFL